MFLNAASPPCLLEYNADGSLSRSSYGSQTTDYTYNLANLLTEVNNANGNT